jgi:2'-5' RNA ligase
LPPHLQQQGWKVKIRDRERVEPPHVTVIRRRDSWRYGLREKEFLDNRPDPRNVPDELLVEIEQQIDTLRQQWDEMYPENPVGV